MRTIKFRAYDSITEYMFIQGTPDLETIQSFFFHVPPNAILMEWTGLLDKNGKEIYEGDIIKRVYSKDEFVLDTVSSEMEWNCGCCDGIYGWEFTNNSSEEIEVIGNIYENPELLTPSQKGQDV